MRGKERIFHPAVGVEIEISGLEIIRGCAQSSGEVWGNNRRFL